VILKCCMSEQSKGLIGSFTVNAWPKINDSGAGLGEGKAVECKNICNCAALL
jgi:hypothetical protein